MTRQFSVTSVIEEAEYYRDFHYLYFTIEEPTALAKEAAPAVTPGMVQYYDAL
jgi:hypothetical protein